MALHILCAPISIKLISMVNLKQLHSAKMRLCVCNTCQFARNDVSQQQRATYKQITKSETLFESQNDSRFHLMPNIGLNQAHPYFSRTSGLKKISDTELLISMALHCLEVLNHIFSEKSATRICASSMLMQKLNVLTSHHWQCPSQNHVLVLNK